MDKSVLIPLRDEITAVDKKLIELFAKRREISSKIVRAKIEANIPVRDVLREQILINLLIKEGKNYNLNELYIQKLYQLIIEDSVILQKQILQSQNNNVITKSAKIAYLGPKGSYSHLAMRKYAYHHFNNVYEFACTNFFEIINKITTKDVDYGILPIENSSSGAINEVYDLLQQTDLHIIAELTLPIEHFILANPNTDFNKIDTLYSHPQPFAQCSNYLNKYPHLKINYCDSTSAAMEIVSKINQPNVAAIGHLDGGHLYGLTAIKDNFANQKQNITRFVVLSRSPIDVSNQIEAKTTILIKTGQQAGALVDALLILREHNINMTKLESRPIHGNPWEEMFYIDLQGNLSSIEMKKALKALSKITLFLKVLGCYPCENELD